MPRLARRRVAPRDLVVDIPAAALLRWGPAPKAVDSVVRVSAVGFSPDGRELLVASSGRRLLVQSSPIGSFAVVDALTGAILLEIQGHDRSFGHVHALAVSTG